MSTSVWCLCTSLSHRSGPINSSRPSMDALKSSSVGAPSLRTSSRVWVTHGEGSSCVPASRLHDCVTHAESCKFCYSPARLSHAHRCCRDAAIAEADAVTLGDAWLGHAIQQRLVQPIPDAEHSAWWVSSLPEHQHMDATGVLATTYAGTRKASAGSVCLCWSAVHFQ